ncbi:MAG: HlyD family efflux transporter periplasmic adaptor subunit [Sedimentisphaerales bacterium]|nr:HlyD family efflux transporter periplasmic adaptor subunit [Sedimentisphaerales bacterium]
MKVKFGAILLVLVFVWFMNGSLSIGQDLPGDNAVSKSYNFVRAQKVVVLRADQPGVITEMPFEPQDFVKQGDVLVQLDSALAEFEVEKLKAQKALSTLLEKAKIRQEYAKDNLKIVTELYNAKVSGDRVGSPKELREAEQTFELSQLESTDAKLELRLLEIGLAQWQKRLEQHTIKAPWDGVVVPFSSIKNVPDIVSVKQSEPGEAVRLGQAVVAMMKVDRLRVPWSESVTYLDKVKTGQAAWVYVPSNSTEPIAAKVVYVSPTVDTTKKFSFEVEFANPPLQSEGESSDLYRYRYRPGMSARVELVD